MQNFSQGAGLSAVRPLACTLASAQGKLDMKADRSVDLSQQAAASGTGHGLLRWAVVLGYAIAAATSIATLTWPIKPDHGVYCWVGDVILRGGMPYRDAWEMKGPMGLYVYALIEGTFGINQWGIRAFDQITDLVTLALVWHLTRRLTDHWMAHLAAIVLWMMYLRPGYYDCAQPDTWGGMLVFGAVALLASASPNRLWRAVVVGLLVGLACLNKFFFVVFLLPLWIYEWQDPSASRRQKIERALAMGASCAAVYAAVILWFWWHGALGDLIEVQFEFNSLVHWSRGSVKHSALSIITRTMLDRTLILMWPLACYGYFYKQPEHQRLKRCLALMIPLNLGLYLLQRKYFPYHLAPIFPELAVLVGCGVARLRAHWQAGQGGWRGSLALRDVLTAGLLMVLVGANSRPEAPDSWRFLAGRLSRDDYYAKCFPTVRVSPTMVLALSDYLDERTTPEETVLVWGFQTEINYLSNRRSPSRFGMSYPLVAMPEAEIGQRYRREFLHEIADHPPAYVLILDEDTCDLLRKPSKELFAEFPEFVLFVNQHYQLESSASHYDIYRRKTGG